MEKPILGHPLKSQIFRLKSTRVMMSQKLHVLTKRDVPNRILSVLTKSLFLLLKLPKVPNRWSADKRNKAGGCWAHAFYRKKSNKCCSFF